MAAKDYVFVILSPKLYKKQTKTAIKSLKSKYSALAQQLIYKE